MGQMTIGANEAVEQGINLCKSGDWDEGLFCLKHILESSRHPEDLPAVFYSYLGYGLARKENRVDEGLALCRRAVELEFYEPANFLNLARTCLLAKDRAGAAEAVQEGLELDPSNKSLQRIAELIGTRRKPVISFLSRKNPLNKALGHIRHRLTQKKEAVPSEDL